MQNAKGGNQIISGFWQVPLIMTGEIHPSKLQMIHWCFELPHVRRDLEAGYMPYLPTNRKQTKHHISVGIDGYTFICASNTALVNRRYGFHCRVKGLSLPLTVNPEGISRTWMWEEHVPGIQMVLIEQAAVMKFHCRVMGLSHPLAVNPVISLETASLWANLRTQM